MPKKFSAIISLIGINPYVSVPENVLKQIFKAAGKDKGAIPVKGTVNGQPFIQTLVRYSGAWRLYINTTMLKDSPKKIGETIVVQVAFDPAARVIPVHPKLATAINKNKKAKAVFEKLSPSRQKEVIRYINFLKTEESVDRNIANVILFLTGKKRFAGRDAP